MPHRRRPRAIRRRALGCERLEPRSMFAADAGILDGAFPVDAPSSWGWAVEGDTIAPDPVDTGTVGDWTPIEAIDDPVFVVFDVLDAGGDGSLPPDILADDGPPPDGLSIDASSIDAPFVDVCFFDSLPTDGGLAIDEVTPDFGPGDEGSEQESIDVLPTVWFDATALPHPVAFSASASAAAEVPATPDPGFLAWAGLMGDRAVFSAPTSPLPTASSGGGSIAPESWARNATPADHPAPVAAIDRASGVVAPAVALPADELPAPPASGLGERISAELPRPL